MDPMGSGMSDASLQGTGKIAEPWVSVEAVAAHVGVRKDSIYRWIEHRGFPAQRVGKLWKLKLSEVDAWITTANRSPSGDREAAPSVALARSSAQAPSGKFILVADDDESIRATLRDFLSDEGYGALLAADGAEALDLLRSSAQPRPSLIILDLSMPNLDGHQFREQQRHDPALSSIPTIVVTSARRANISGAVMLHKPLDLARLADTIQKLTGSGGQ